MNPFKNKYFSIMGDSISTFEGYLPAGFACHYDKVRRCETGVFSAEECWWARVIKHFEGELLVNNSFSGSYVCKIPGCEIASYGCSDERTDGLGRDGIAPDFILVYMGSNDRGAGLRLTSIDKNDLSVIENGYRVMLEKIKANYPQAKIFCCTFPITTCSRDQEYVFPRTYWGNPMTMYGETVKKVAENCGCSVIDLWDEAYFCDTADGLHPNFEGMKMIAEKVIAALEEKKE